MNRSSSIRRRSDLFRAGGRQERLDWLDLVAQQPLQFGSDGVSTAAFGLQVRDWIDAKGFTQPLDRSTQFVIDAPTRTDLLLECVRPERVVRYPACRQLSGISAFVVGRGGLFVGLTLQLEQFREFVLNLRLRFCTRERSAAGPTIRSSTSWLRPGGLVVVTSSKSSAAMVIVTRSPSRNEPPSARRTAALKSNSCSTDTCCFFAVPFSCGVKLRRFGTSWT